MTTMTKVAHFTCDVCEAIRDLTIKFMKKTCGAHIFALTSRKKRCKRFSLLSTYSPESEEHIRYPYHVIIVEVWQNFGRFLIILQHF